MLLAAADCLIERLTAHCPAAAGHVFSATDLAGVADAAQITPALHVILAGYRPLQTAPSGDTQWEETYWVVAVVRHSARRDREVRQQVAAQTLVDEALAALSGWRFLVASPGHPTREVRLTPVQGPPPLFTDIHAYFPLAFALTTATVGAGRMT